MKAMREFIPRPLGAWRDFYRSSSGILHGQPLTCSALESQRERVGHDEFSARLTQGQMFTRVRVTRAQYASFDFSRVCRKCAWEPVASFLLAQPVGPDALPVTFAMTNASDRQAATFSGSANARLARAVAGTSLALAFTGVGSIAFGWVSPSALTFLRANATVFDVSGQLLERPDAPSVLTAAWSMWSSLTPGMSQQESAHLFREKVEQSQLAFF